MTHSALFQATPGGLALSGAILLYSSGTTPAGTPRAGATTFASIHPIEQSDGAPAIAAGAPLTRAHLRAWTEALGRTVLPEILPANVLVAHPDMLAWWVPAQVRTAYFALSKPPAGAKCLAGRTSVPVPYPAHLFIATRSGLGVYALAESKRPEANTPVLFSPILNIFINGQLCWGNIAKPKTLNVPAMQEYEDAVFDSWSTHANPGQELTVSGKGGLVRLWDDLAARRVQRFPVKRLKPFVHGAGRGGPRASNKPADSVTVGQLIARGARA